MFNYTTFLELYNQGKIRVMKHCGLQYISENPEVLANLDKSQNCLSYLQVGGKHGVVLIFNDKNSENSGLDHHFIFFKDETYRQYKPEELEENIRIALKIFNVENGRFDDRITELYKNLLIKNDAGIFTIFDKKLNDAHRYSFQDAGYPDIKFLDENFETTLKNCENYCQQLRGKSSSLNKF